MEAMQEGKTGTFITFEGVDGCGKSTQLAYVRAALAEAGIDAIYLREPGGTDIGEKVRDLLLDPHNVEMAPEAELLLYEASRAQLVRQVIEPALRSGGVVICDRFFDSTFAYQASARGLAEDAVLSANQLGSCGIHPTLTVVLDLDPEVAYGRATKGGADRLEAEGARFQQRVRAGYHRMAELEPDRVRLVSAEGTPEEVFARVAAVLAGALPQLAELDVERFCGLQRDVEQQMEGIASLLGKDAPDA